ncbi:MAG: universal stress protein, partial [Verrucomicrobiota bacterium]
MKIICGTDFTPNAQDATRVAAALARRLGDSLDLVHAVAKPPVKGLDAEVWRGYLEPLREELEEKARPHREQGLTVRTQLKVGSAADSLVAAAARRNVRLLVLASIGRVAVSRLLVGSVAERAAEASTAPTLVVRRPAPLLGWAEGRAPLKVFVTADFSPASDAALRWVRHWREAGPCEVTVAYLDWPPEEGRRL